MKGKRKPDAAIDLGLAVLAATSCPPHTCDEIAAYCGVSCQAIQQIEQKALRKVRAHFYRQKIKKLIDLT
jgi:DNA-directed RNA polymerase sigma subunit (sigma70/sigma32)